MSVARRRTLAAAAIASLVMLSACNRGGGSSDVEAFEVPSEVTQLVEKSLGNPVSIGYDVPLSKPAPSGKSIVVLQVPVDVAKVEAEAMQKAAAALGWDFENIVVEATPEGPAKAMDQAIDQKPDGIYYSGYDTAVISKQLQRAAAEGIAVFSEALGADTPDEAFGQIRGTVGVERLADIVAAWLVADSKGTANVLIVDTPAFPILHAYSERVEASVKRWCPSCKVSSLDANVTDIGTALPGQIVSELQRSPQIDYLVYSFGDLSVGVNAALSTAGLQDQVKVGGQLPGLENLKNLKSGEEAMWVPELSPLIGWRVIDAFARHFVGDDVEIAADGSPAPTQILTHDNVDGAVFDPSGYWVGVAGYELTFKQLWNVQ